MDEKVGLQSDALGCFSDFDLWKESFQKTDNFNLLSKPYDIINISINVLIIL